MDQSSFKRIEQNLLEVNQRISAAANRAGNSPDSVQLIAVTKYVGIDEIQCLAECGCTVFGESRPQQLWEKTEHFADRNFSWHMIGNLQRNKAKRTVPLISTLHSGNSIRLLKTLNDQSEESSEPLKVLIEVNISGDQTKHGFTEEQLPEVFEQAAQFSHLKFIGLMGMAARDGDLSVARKNFSTLRELRDRFNSQTADNISLEQLSMGMSRDYEIAIEEGATMVRVGSGLFQGLKND